MLAGRCLADYGIQQGDCLLICGSDAELVQQLQRGFLETTQLTLTALYSTEEICRQAQSRIAAAGQADRVTCHVGGIDALPFREASFDLVAGVGPVLIWSRRQEAMREVYRVLRPRGVALIGGQYLQMPADRKVSNEQLQTDARETGIRSIRILRDQGQWVEIRKEAE